jgi:hypothetical protein
MREPAPVSSPRDPGFNHEIRTELTLRGAALVVKIIAIFTNEGGLSSGNSLDLNPGLTFMGGGSGEGRDVLGC